MKETYYLCLYDNIDDDITKFAEYINVNNLHEYIKFIKINDIHKRWLKHNEKKIHITVFPVIIKYIKSTYPKLYKLDEQSIIINELKELQNLYGS